MALRLLSIVTIVLSTALIPPRLTADVTPAEIESALNRGIEYLRKSAGTRDYGGNVLLAYTLAKTGSPPDHPLIVKVVSDLREQLGASTPSLQDHYYNAGLAAMLFDTLGGETHQTELQQVADYIVAGQRSNGGWFYEGRKPDLAVGDTSITQYALLGLWAAERNGIEIPKQVWSRAATWLANTQLPNGAFMYHPNDQQRRSTSLSVRPSLAAAGTSSLILCKRQLYPHGFEAEARKRREKRAIAESVKLYGGLLELVDVTRPEEDPAERKQDQADVALIAPSRLQSHIKAGMRHLESLPEMGLREQLWRLYYLYGIERLGAFAEIEQLGDEDWYQTGAEFLIEMQHKQLGSWKGQREETISTCFAVLFLYRATAKSIRPPASPAPKIGSGLLAGGRGLPSDLTTVQQKDGRIVAEKVDAPVTDLLTQLESNAAAELRPIQKAIIESVRSDQREELIGQVDRLEKLLESPDKDVRAIAVWSLARSNDLSRAPLLIERIRKDPDYDVAREANRGLCVLSRRLQGVGYNSDPVSEVDRERDAEKVKQRILQWRASAAKAWQDWYLKVRPYDERDDLLDLDVKQN